MGNLAPAGVRTVRGRPAERHDRHSHPRVTDEEAEAQRRGTTSQGQTAPTWALPTLAGCVLIVFDEPSQPEVSHFAHEVLAHQDVGSTEIPVDVVHPLHVGHA